MSERTSKVSNVANTNEFDLHQLDIMKATAMVMNGWGAVNSRLISFAQNSLQNNLNAADEFRQCQTPREVMDTQIRLARKTYDDCLDEARQLGALLSKMSSEAVDVLNMSK